jgi:NDP-sugar pyrophosphorylase family protein
MYKISELYDLNYTICGNYLEKFVYPWEALSGLNKYVQTLGMSLNKDDYKEILPHVWVHKTAFVSPTAFLGSECIICENAEIRHNAFLRGNAVVGKNAVVGNSTELKNSILFDNVQVPHYNYVGDSILGYKTHLGAGAVTSNVKSDKSCITIRNANAVYETNLKKCGAMLGDYVEVGCNSVLNPGTIVGKHSTIYPLSCVRGVVPSNSIFKAKAEIVQKK